MADESVYVEIISALESRLNAQEKEISDLKEALERARVNIIEQAFSNTAEKAQESQPTEESRSDLPQINFTRQVSGAFMSNSVKFFAKIVGGVATIEFPKGGNTHE